MIGPNGDVLATDTLVVPVRYRRSMDDAAIIQQIDDLVAEEHQLERDHAATGLGPEDQARLNGLEEQLDQAWDLLRQRRARREAGQDPEAAHLRTARVVEGYQQ